MAFKKANLEHEETSLLNHTFDQNARSSESTDSTHSHVDGPSRRPAYRTDIGESSQGSISGKYTAGINSEKPQDSRVAKLLFSSFTSWIVCNA